jgi:hypothetical protein
MAISPKLLDEKFMKEVSRIEEQLDDKLSSCSLGPAKRVNIDVPREMNHSHFQILKPRYIAAGWKDVTWNSDQREGDWLVFES